MQLWIGLVAGVIIGWLIEWIIDWLYWRRSTEAAFQVETQLRDELAAIRRENTQLRRQLNDAHSPTPATPSQNSPASFSEEE